MSSLRPEEAGDFLESLPAAVVPLELNCSSVRVIIFGFVRVAEVGRRAAETLPGGTCRYSTTSRKSGMVRRAVRRNACVAGAPGRMPVEKDSRPEAGYLQRRVASCRNRPLRSGRQA